MLTRFHAMVAGGCLRFHCPQANLFMLTRSSAVHSATDACFHCPQANLFMLTLFRRSDRTV